MGEDAQQTKADGREPPIPGNAFASVGVASTRGSQSLYPKSIAVDRLIMRSVRTLGVTRFQLAKLLGCSNPSMIFRAWHRMQGCGLSSPRDVIAMDYQRRPAITPVTGDSPPSSLPPRLYCTQRGAYLR
jgi:hypothetical protein